MAAGIVGLSLQVLEHFTIGQDAGGCLTAAHPALDQGHNRPTCEEVGGEWGGVEQVPPHSSIGGAGGAAWRMRSSSSAACSQSRSLHALASRTASAMSAASASPPVGTSPAK